MSDPPNPPPSPNLPDGVPAPPPPRPHLKDPRASGPTYGADEIGKKGHKKKKKERTHPTDAYPPLRQKKGCGGCLGCVGGLTLSVVLLAALLAGLAAYYGPGRFVSQDYTLVKLETQEASLQVAPTEATVYLAPGTVRYQASVTSVPIAIIAREIVAEGDFLDEASFTAVKVTATEKARFAKNLEVFAAEFNDEGLTLKGDLTGRVITNKP